MKIRSGFVSNSSSSSFIVVGEKPPVTCAKLEKDVAKRILEYIKSETKCTAVFDEAKDYYLTQYLSDGGDFDEPFDHLEHYSYLDGGHGGPYSYEGKKDEYLFLLEGEEDFGGIFVRKIDLNPRQHFKNEVKKLAETLGINYNLVLK